MNNKLMVAFQKGETWAFAEIYSRFMKPVRNYVNIRVQNEDIAQEITQDIFLKVYRFSSSYRRSFAFTTWLWTIAKNTISDFMRHPEAERLRNPHLTIEPDDLIASDPGAEEKLSQKSARKMIFQFSRSLTPAQRRALWLRVVRQLSYQEISEKLNLSISGARGLVHRARLQLETLGVPRTLAEHC